MAALQLNGISKQFADSQVLDEISLSVADGEFVSLVGPSGCGKSTLLRIIAGLEQQSTGTITIGGRDMSGVRAADRNLSMVFQSYALYPHLTVAENIAVPLRMRRLSASQRLPVLGGLLPGARALNKQIAEDVYHTASVLEIDLLLDRKPGELSGGQRQRVALGRAIVRDPAAFLFDEPLSNLDAKLRVQTRSEIAELHRRLGATFVYVTHDQVEAMTMSGRIAVMMDGRILQCGSPDRIYNDPEDIRVAEFIGSPKINILPADLSDNAVRIHDLPLPLQGMASTERALKVGIRPEALSLAGSEGRLAGRVGHLENLGSEVYLHVNAAGSNKRLVVKASPDQSRHLNVGSPVRLDFDTRALLVFDHEGKRQRTIERALAPQREVA